MEERIINLLKKHALSRKVILEFFSDDKLTNASLKSLEEQGKVVYYNHKYYLPYMLHLVKGKITSIKDTYSFASIENQEDGYISNSNLNSSTVIACPPIGSNNSTPGIPKANFFCVKSICTHGQLQYG
jgi:ribosomal protein S1